MPATATRSGSRFALPVARIRDRLTRGVGAMQGQRRRSGPCLQHLRVTDDPGNLDIYVDNDNHQIAGMFECSELITWIDLDPATTQACIPHSGQVSMSFKAFRSPVFRRYRANRLARIASSGL
jgi:hypothetical protein